SRYACWKWACLRHFHPGPPLLLLPRRNVEIGQRAFDRIGSSRHGLRESRMGMHRQADVGRIAAVLDGERHLADELARMGAHDARAEQTAALRIEEELGHSLFTPEREGAAAGHPG